MREAIKAFNIGDKLFQIERIHSKLVHLSRDPEILNERHSDGNLHLENALQALVRSVNCFSNNAKNKHFYNYLNAISQAGQILRESDLNRIFYACCFMHGEYIKFRRRLKKGLLKEPCELEYQDVCIPLLFLDERLIKQRRLDNNKS